MRRFLILGFLLTVPGMALAFHDLTLNGLPAVTVTRGDPVLMAGFFDAPGDTAVLRIYYDLNNNGSLDADDPLLDRSNLWDGSWSDLDETANGQYQDTIKTEGIPQGTYFLRVADAGGADEATLIVVEPQEGIHVTGIVAVPPATPGLLVLFLPADTSEHLPPFEGFTNALGTFSIWVPQEYAGSHWFPVVFDLLVQAPGYLSPVDFGDTLVLNAPVTTVNLALQPSDGTEIQGTLQDEDGNPVPLDSIQVLAFGMYTNFVDTSFAFTVTRVLGGSFTLPVSGPFGFYQVAPTSMEPFLPRYLAPGAELVILTGGSAQTTLTAYHTDATITGHVYFNESDPADHIVVRATGYQIGPSFPEGMTYTGTYSDGHYEMWVSSTLSQYQVSVDPGSIPDSFYVQEGTQTVGPGATDVDFHLYPVAVEETLEPRPTLAVRNFPGLVRDHLSFVVATPRDLPLELELYDVTGRRLASLGTWQLSPGEHRMDLRLPNELPQGAYVLVARSQNRVLWSRRFVKM